MGDATPPCVGPARKGAGRRSVPEPAAAPGQRLVLPLALAGVALSAAAGVARSHSGGRVRALDGMRGVAVAVFLAYSICQGTVTSTFITGSPILTGPTHAGAPAVPPAGVARWPRRARLPGGRVCGTRRGSGPGRTGRPVWAHGARSRVHAKRLGPIWRGRQAVDQRPLLRHSGAHAAVGR